MQMSNVLNFKILLFSKSTADKIDLPDKTCGHLATSTQTFDYIKNVIKALMETKEFSN